VTGENKIRYFRLILFSKFTTLKVSRTVDEFLIILYNRIDRIAAKKLEEQKDREYLQFQINTLYKKKGEKVLLVNLLKFNRLKPRGLPN
jgi:hypothetical protein